MIIAFVASLLLAEAARAHVSVRPGLLESGRTTTLRIELPELRPGQPPSALDVSGSGLRMLESSSAGRLGEESQWRVRVAVETEPGPLDLVLSARYPDGRSVVVRQPVTVLPARSTATSSNWPVIAVILGALGLIGAVTSIAVIRRAREPIRPRSG